MNNGFPPVLSGGGQDYVNKFISVFTFPLQEPQIIRRKKRNLALKAIEDETGDRPTSKANPGVQAIHL
jgi:hypothetical protein